MIKNITAHTLILLLLFTITKLGAQDIQNIRHNSWSVIFNVGHQDDLIKFENSSVNKYHEIIIRPLFIGGIQKTWNNKNRFRLYQDAVATYHIHPYQEKTFGIGTNLGFEFLALKRIIITPKIGVHYNYAKYADVQYGYVDDKWTKVDNIYEPSHRTVIKIGLETGYRLNEKIDIIGGVSGNVITPFIKNVLPVFFTYGVYAGVRYSL
jgi:hypothetical protein